MSLTITTDVLLSTLEPWPGNARVHDLGVIMNSLKIHGQYKPLVVQRSSGRVLAGNGTFEAMLSLGWTHGSVAYQDVDDEGALAINLIDNRAYDLGGYDEGKLLAQLEAARDLLAAGYGVGDVDDLRARIENAVTLKVQAGEWNHAAATRGPSEDARAGLASAVRREFMLIYTLTEADVFTKGTERIRELLSLPSTGAAVLYAVNDLVERMKV